MKPRYSFFVRFCSPDSVPQPISGALAGLTPKRGCYADNAIRKTNQMARADFAFPPHSE